MMKLFDTHAHLDDDRFGKDLPEVVQRATEAGVIRIITIGIDVATSRANLALVEQHPLLRAAVGIQPNHVAEAVQGDWEVILQLAADPKVVAIGETGLDRYWDRAPFPLQEDYFCRHLELSYQLKKPVIIHCREAEEDIICTCEPFFAQHGTVHGVLHSYTGNLPCALRGVEMGLYVSFAGMLTYNSAENVREVAKEIPLDRLLIETDAPYLAPVPKRGKRNEPAFVAHTAEFMANLRGISVRELCDLTTHNAQTLFGC
ncbi:MAG: TatD family hydrolase [Zavarzinella sp.]